MFRRLRIGGFGSGRWGASQNARRHPPSPTSLQHRFKLCIKLCLVRLAVIESHSRQSLRRELLQRLPTRFHAPTRTVTPHDYRKRPAPVRHHHHRRKCFACARPQRQPFAMKRITRLGPKQAGKQEDGNKDKDVEIF